MCAIVIQCAVELSRHEEICIVETLYDLQREAVPFPLGKLWLRMNFQLGHIDVACSTITRALQNLLDSKTETQDLFALVRFINGIKHIHSLAHTHTFMLLLQSTLLRTKIKSLRPRPALQGAFGAPLDRNSFETKI